MKKAPVRKLYVCQINHRYSFASLCAEKEDRVEYTLRSALVQLTQLQMLYRSLAQEPVLSPGGKRTAIRRRIREAQQQCAAIRALIEATHVVELGI